MRWVSVLLLAAAFFHPSKLDAQRYPFVHYTPKDGLVSARARQMFQDNKGRLYVATFGGLSIYDGARFTNYTIDNGLASNIVNDFVQMGDDSVWVVLNTNRMQCYAGGKLKDVALTDGFCPVINKLIKHTDGFYYALADEGLFRLQNNKFVRIDIKDENGKDISRNFSTGSIIDDKVFIVTDPTIGFYPSPSYLIVYNLRTRKTCISKKPPEFYTVAASPQNDILVGTSEGLKNLDKLALEQGRIAFTELPALYKSAQNIGTIHIYVDRQQNLWLTAGNGIYKIDTRGQLKMFSTDNGLPVNLHYSVFQDREQIMWFVNEQTGISKLANTQIEFYSQLKPGFTASDIYADNRSDSVWLYDDTHKKVLVQWPNGSKEFSVDTDIRWLFRMVPGNTVNYLAGYFEVYGYNKNAGPTIKPQLIYSYRDSLAGVPMISFPLRDDHGNFLYSNNNINAIVEGSKLVSYPLGYYADQFVIGPGNHLWITNRQDKLFLFKIHPEDPANYFELLKEYSHIARGPRSIALDNNGNLWIGTRDLGVFCFAVDEKFNLRLKHQASTKNGLSDNCILSLHADDEGNVWACSPVGLDKLQLKNNKWVVESITRGNNIYQNVRKTQTTRSGENWVLTSAGIIRVAPSAALRHERLQTNILFAEVKAGRDTLSPVNNHAAISYKKNDVSFQWSVPTFVAEKQTLFSYRLQGSATDEWSQPSHEASVRFVNLAPCKYVLHVKAIFPNGLYPEANAQYAFQILSPWWQTWWFKALILAAAGGLIVLLVRGYFRRKLERQRILLEKRQAIEKERSRIASDMHDDLGAGLSTIRFLSEKVRRNPVTDVTKNEIEKIAGISVELVENMNEIIWAMNEENDTLEDLLFYTRSYAKEYCEENQLHCVVDFPEQIPPVFVSGELRRNVFLTVKESLHNIVKYARATEVEFSIHVNEELTVVIKDNGAGFSTHDHNTGGNGLRNMRRRIESIGGQFAVLNGQGVTVKLQVPLER